MAVPHFKKNDVKKIYFYPLDVKISLLQIRNEGICFSIIQKNALFHLSAN